MPLFSLDFAHAIIICYMALSHAEAVNHLSKQLGYPLSVKETSANIRKLLSSTYDCCLVAVEDLSVVGWIHAFVAHRIESNPFVEIGGLVIDETHRSKGIGKRLIEAVTQWGIRKKISTLRVRSNVKRNEAHRFYTNLGFAAIKEQKIFERKLR